MVVRDIINTWTHDLESHVESFMEQARQIKKWDTQMMENRNKIYGLGHHVEDLKAQQGLLTETLEKILTSQSELRATFERLEEEAPDVKSTNDIEIRREETYKLAEHIDTRLNMMEDELGGIIENLNTSAETYDDPNSPVSNILSILNEHTTVLQWLDDAALDVESKLRDADMRLKDVDIARSSAMM
jgi:nuclear pore complex protein Nup62